MKNSPHQHGISVKKEHGQNFLRDAALLDRIVGYAAIPAGASVIEIGCGDGALTRALLATPLAQLRVYEIDPEWADHVKNSVRDPRLTIVQKDILTADSRCEPSLPYHVSDSSKNTQKPGICFARGVYGAGRSCSKTCGYSGQIIWSSEYFLSAFLGACTP
jgi:hypothetical protein